MNTQVQRMLRTIHHELRRRIEKDGGVVDFKVEFDREEETVVYTVWRPDKQQGIRYTFLPEEEDGAEIWAEVTHLGIGGKEVSQKILRFHDLRDAKRDVMERTLMARIGIRFGKSGDLTYASKVAARYVTLNALLGT